MDAHVDAVQSINKLCSSNIGLCTALREHNGVTPLVFLLDWDHATPAVVKSAIICLMNCSRRDANIRDDICSEMGIGPIVALMGREQERIIVEKAAWTLNNLATGNASNQALVRAAGGVRATLAVLDWARDAPTMKAALATIIHLAEDPGWWFLGFVRFRRCCVRSLLKLRDRCRLVSGLLKLRDRCRLVSMLMQKRRRRWRRGAESRSW
jgi:hypothetical protein